MTARTYQARGINGSESFRWNGIAQSPIVVVAPGDRVQLAWWGDAGVPKGCDGAWATVLRCNPKRMVVQPSGFASTYTLSVLPERHVVAVRPSETC
jgi:hypothetical protein